MKLSGRAKAVDASDEPSVVPALGVNVALETSWSGSAAGGWAGGGGARRRDRSGRHDRQEVAAPVAIAAARGQQDGRQGTGEQHGLEGNAGSGE
jgi:hypothetical protein